MWWNCSSYFPKNTSAILSITSRQLLIGLLCSLPLCCRTDFVSAQSAILEQKIIVEEKQPQMLQPLRPENSAARPGRNQTSAQARNPSTAAPHPSSRETEYLLDSMDLNALSPHAPLLALPRMVTPKLALALREGLAPPQWEGLIAEAAQHYDLPPALVAAVIKTESNFQASAVSPKGAQGLMQLMPATQQHMGVNDPLDPRANVLAGCGYLRRQLERFGDLDLALAAYNAGPENVARYGGMPPFAETRDFVCRVRAHMEQDAL